MTLDDYRHWYDVFDSDDEELWNWSVWDHDRVSEGDKFYLVRVGNEGVRGIMVRGTVSSNPWQGQDWSGRGRQTFYVDLYPTQMFAVDSPTMITQAMLQQAVPSFDWTGGHSGRVLTDEQALQLEDFVNNFIWSQPTEKLEPDKAKFRSDIVIEDEEKDDDDDRLI